MKNKKTVIYIYKKKSPFLFQLPEKNTFLLDPCGYMQRERENAAFEQ